MTVLSVDFETYGTVELKRSGVYPYAKHSDTNFWLMGWAFDDDEPATWYPGQPLPHAIREHAEAGGEMRAWNAQFERIMWQEIGLVRYGFPRVAMEQWVDTAAEAVAMGLPRALDKAAHVLGIDMKKDMKAHKLMVKMARPRKWDEINQRFIWWDSEKNLAILTEYNKQDVRTERAAAKVLRRLTKRERAIYLLDQEINDRGVYLDVTLATAAKELATREMARQNALLAEATDGMVEKTTRVAQLKEWLALQGLETDSLAKAALRELLAPDGPIVLSTDVRKALTARSEAAKSSVAKIDAMFNALNPDGRMRGLLAYHAAHTGRWGGRLVQPQNFPRGLDVKHPERFLDAIQRYDLDGALSEEDYTVLQVISANLRAMLIGGPGLDLMAGDFAAIEARVLAWVAGEEQQLAIYREGKSPYPPMGAVIYNRPAEEIIKPSTEYTIAKNTVLGAGYQMGAVRFREQVKEQTGIEISVNLAESAIGAYRALNTKIVGYWHAVNEAALSAVANPGVIEEVNRTRFVVRGGYLWIVLPSGRSLAYARPRIEDRETPWGAVRPTVHYMGMNTYTHRWSKLHLYGGSITENIVQGVARDLLADAMLRVRTHYPVVLTVHDEIVVEASEDDVAALDAFTGLMKATEPWAQGIPIDVEVWKGKRYRK